uniref:calcium and integrin-binding family member 3-like isoform X2 n=1 Tax=Vespula vulgaris TaxID=7454 RepID=UPI00223B75B1|nr:calcium and integrin-binding family member 3-like isoform X2 [Vespula vulgaris]
MGNKVATFSEEQLEDYQDCTFFTRKEILRIFKRFREMGDPGMVPRTMTSQEASTLRLPLSYLARIPELKENPFRERISEVFTKSNRKQQSENTEDFDEDGVLGIGDLERTCRQLVQDGLTSEEVYTVCQKVLEESDIDGDGALSYLDFEHVVTRTPDFISTFHIRI